VKVLVTGATGFIGTHIVKELAGSGHELVGIDLRPPDAAVAAYLGADAARVRFAVADISDRRSLEEAVSGPLDGVVHAAVVTSTPEVEVNEPQRVIAGNLLGTIEVLRVAELRRAARVVYVSSSGVYGATEPDALLSECHRLQLHTLYTMTKYASECLVTSGADRGTFEAASARIAAPYGPMERPTGARTAMSIMHAMAHAALERRAVRLAGPDCGRDWTYAGDIALAVRLLLEAPRLDYPCYNVSSGVFRTLGDAARALALAVPGFVWEPAPSDAADLDGGAVQPRGPLALDRIRGLGFVPRYTLEDGLRETVTWLRRFREAGAAIDSGGVG